MIITPKTDGIYCRICGKTTHLIHEHLETAHKGHFSRSESLPILAYMKQFPGAPTISAALEQLWAKEQTLAKKRKRTPITAQGFKLPLIDIAGIPFPVYVNVPARFCLPIPAHYRVPTHGDLGQDVADVMESIADALSVFIWGPPGTGKDALLHYLSGACRRPAKVFQVNPSADTQEWLYTLGFDKDGIIYELGDLFTALTEGYTAPNGDRMGYMILVSDFDRAEKEQAEVMRMITDSISGRVQGPKGAMYNVFQPEDPTMPRTQFVFTGNSCGFGDPRNLCLTNVMDSSLLNRINHKYKFHNIAWEDESEIMRAKYPDVVERIGETTFGNVGKAITAIREGIEKENIYAEYSHRTACDWFTKMRAKMNRRYPTSQLPKKFLLDCARVFLDGMDDTNREQTKVAMNAHIKDGCVDQPGDLSFLKHGQLKA